MKNRQRCTENRSELERKEGQELKRLERIKKIQTSKQVAKQKKMTGCKENLVADEMGKTRNQIVKEKKSCKVKNITKIKKKNK